MKLALWKPVLGLLLAATLGTAAIADEQRALLVGVQCHYNPAGRFIVRLSTGPTVKSVRLYSEPSHHLLAALADIHWAETPEGEAFIADARGEHPSKDPVITATMVGALIHVDGWSEDPPPAGDNAIKAFVRTTHDDDEKLGLYTHVNLRREFGTEAYEP